MKKVLLGLSALAMAFSISSVSFSDTLLLPASNSCGCMKQGFAFYQQMPTCAQKRIFSYYQPIAPRCCGAAAPCCAAPVQPCCEKPAPCGCGCGCKKHKKVKKCNCGK